MSTGEDVYDQPRMWCHICGTDAHADCEPSDYDLRYECMECSKPIDTDDNDVCPEGTWHMHKTCLDNASPHSKNCALDGVEVEVYTEEFGTRRGRWVSSQNVNTGAAMLTIVDTSDGHLIMRTWVENLDRISVSARDYPQVSIGEDS